MKHLLLILLILKINTLHAQAVIDCGEGSCEFPVEASPIYEGGGSNHTSFDLMNTEADLSILVPPTHRPENLRTNISNRSYYDKNLDINLSSNNTLGSKAGELLLISDIVNDLTVALDGTTGVDGKSSAQLCGENFLAGIYGADARTYFENRRIADTNLNNYCDTQDVNWIKDNKFMCPVGFNEVSSANVDITRYQARRKCSGVLQETRCLKRSVSITCSTNKISKACCDTYNYTWKAVERDGNLTPPIFGAACDEIACVEMGGGWYQSGMVHDAVFEVWEHELLSKSEKQICEEKRDENKPFVAYSTWVHEIPGDELSPLIPGPPSNTVDAEYGSTDNNHFIVPMPDIVNFPAHASPNSFDYTNMRVKIYKSESTVSVRDCFGLDGSAFNDRECVRTTYGPQADAGLVLAFLDENGAESNKIYVNVPEGKKVIVTPYRLCVNGDNWNAGYANYWSGPPGYLTGQYDCGNREYGCAFSRNFAFYPTFDQVTLKQLYNIAATRMGLTPATSETIIQEAQVNNMYQKAYVSSRRQYVTGHNTTGINPGELYFPLKLSKLTEKTCECVSASSSAYNNAACYEVSCDKFRYPRYVQHIADPIWLTGTTEEAAGAFTPIGDGSHLYFARQNGGNIHTDQGITEGVVGDRWRIKHRSADFEYRYTK